MKKVLFLGLLALSISACSSSPQIKPQDQAASPGAGRDANNKVSVMSHSTEKGAQPTPPSSGANGAPPAGNSPMSRAIDVSAMTEAIEKTKKIYDKSPKDEKAKGDLADAYFERALALTDAAQYRAALGDFRKGLKLDPDNEEAKKMHDQIISIFKSVGREPPKEGEEPEPMPFTKG